MVVMAPVFANLTQVASKCRLLTAGGIIVPVHEEMWFAHFH